MALVEARLEEEKNAAAVVSPKTSAALSVKNVLFATDFSFTSESARPYAIALCRHFGSTLHTAHVLSDDNIVAMTGGVDYVGLSALYEDARSQAKEKLSQISSRLRGIPHRDYVPHGGIWENLAEIVEENRIDVIVLGTHGRTGLGKLLLGSVAENILRHALCPVLTVGPKVCGRAKLSANSGNDLSPLDLDLRQIVFATNFAPNSSRIAKHAVSLAEEFQSRLTLLHVTENYRQRGSRTTPIEDELGRLRNLIPENTLLQYRPDTVVEFGFPSDRILKIASKLEADLIVLGARAAEAGNTHLPWSTAHHVIAGAHCPVLTIRG
jgi:nucleotide-binding universal stress UspA family protein